LKKDFPVLKFLQAFDDQAAIRCLIFFEGDSYGKNSDDDASG